LLLQLVEDGLVTRQQAEEVVDERERTGKPVRETLIAMDIISEDDLLQAIATHLGTSVIDLIHSDLSPSVLKSIPGSVARMYNVVPVESDAHSVVLATYDLLSPQLVDELNFVLTR